MQTRFSGWLKGGIAAAALLVGTVAWATTGHLPFTLADVNAQGRLVGPGTKTQFNYVLHNGHFHGKATGIVKNLFRVHGRPHAVRFHDTGHISGFTIEADHTLVEASGLCIYVAHGTKP